MATALLVQDRLWQKTEPEGQGRGRGTESMQKLRSASSTRAVQALSYPFLPLLSIP